MTGPGKFLAGALAALLLAACGTGPDRDDVIDRETFIATYIDLRRTGLGAPSGELDAAARERVLQEHGVTEAQLLDFADAHGRDVDFMLDVWSEVEDRMDSIATAPEGPST